MEAAIQVHFRASKVKQLLQGLRALRTGLTNRSLRELIAGLTSVYGARQMAYDLRRLRRKGSSSGSPAPSATR